MQGYQYKLVCLFTAILLCGGAAAATGAKGGILRDEAVAGAEPAVLASEARLFARIKDGVMLTLAECQLADSCEPSVDIGEVERILHKIDTRITTLSSRYAESNNKQLEEALLIYANAREGYVEALDRLEALAGEDTAAPAGGEATEEDFSDLFEDVDEEL